MHRSSVIRFTVAFLVLLSAAQGPAAAAMPYFCCGGLSSGTNEPLEQEDIPLDGDTTMQASARLRADLQRMRRVPLHWRDAVRFDGTGRCFVCSRRRTGRSIESLFCGAVSPPSARLAPHHHVRVRQKSPASALSINSTQSLFPYFCGEDYASRSIQVLHRCL